MLMPPDPTRGPDYVPSLGPGFAESLWSVVENLDPVRVYLLPPDPEERTDEGADQPGVLVLVRNGQHRKQDASFLSRAKLRAHIEVMPLARFRDQVRRDGDTLRRRLGCGQVLFSRAPDEFVFRNRQPATRPAAARRAGPASH